MPTQLLPHVPAHTYVECKISGQKPTQLHEGFPRIHNVGDSKTNAHIYIYIYTYISMCIKNIDIYTYIWMFPKIGVRQIIHLFIGFSNINHPFWGTTIFGNTHILRHVHLLSLRSRVYIHLYHGYPASWGGFHQPQKPETCQITLPETNKKNTGNRPKLPRNELEPLTWTIDFHGLLLSDSWRAIIVNFGGMQKNWMPHSSLLGRRSWEKNRIHLLSLLKYFLYVDWLM